MRIGSDHSYLSTINARGHVSSAQTDQGFADTLASAVGSRASETDGSPPELSAATYRLFAAISLERGNTEQAAIHLSRVADAREPGLPLRPSGVLSELGRWDFNEAAAALPETGRFDSGTGQGNLTFIPYKPWSGKPTIDASAPTRSTAIAAPTADAPLTPTANQTVDRLRGNLASLGESTRSVRSPRLERSADIEALLDILPS